MALSWTHPICDDDWTKFNGVELDGELLVREPIRLKIRTKETCAYCGQDTESGIYVRDNPDHVPFPQED